MFAAMIRGLTQAYDDLTKESRLQKEEAIRTDIDNVCQEVEEEYKNLSQQKEASIRHLIQLDMPIESIAKRVNVNIELVILVLYGQHALYRYFKNKDDFLQSNPQLKIF